ARAVATQLGITHRVFDFRDDFTAVVVNPYVAGHAAGLTPNPCVECNRHLKFGRLARRATQLGFDAVATGHHARIVPAAAGHLALRRGADPAKDQSYVLYVLGQEQLARLAFPVGEMTKAEVRRRAAALGLRTAAKPDSQDACFVNTAGGRRPFLESRLPLHPATVVDAATGAALGTVDAVELVTLGQRRGLNAGGGGGPRRYAVGIDVAGATVTVGPRSALLVERVEVDRWAWVDLPLAPGTPVVAQSSAHGPALAATVEAAAVRFDAPQRAVAPGQSVVVYDRATAEEVLGGGISSPAGR
ncbi:MAG: MnmA/TRMU family protein, partial [Acidimicrobiales bacterium]